MKTLSSWRKPTPPEPPRQIPYGLHPVLDMMVMLQALAENQVKLAEGQMRMMRSMLIAYLMMFTAYGLLFLAYWLSRQS